MKKAVSRALCAIGTRRAALQSARVELARILAGSDDATRRWTGKDALRALTKSAGETKTNREP